MEALPAIQRGDGDRFRSLERVVAELASPRAVERMAEVIGEASASALGAEFVVVALADAYGHVRPVHATGVAAGAVDQVLMGPVDGDEIVAQPIAVGARTLGRVVLGRRSGRPFSEADRGFVHVLAGLFALAVDRPRAPSRPVRLGDLAIDLARHEVSIDGRAARLTPSELRLLLLLAEQPGRPRSRRRSFAACPAPTPPGTSGRATSTSPTCAASSSGTRRGPSGCSRCAASVTR